jgi:hypothetical protein
MGREGRRGQGPITDKAGEGGALVVHSLPVLCGERPLTVGWGGEEEIGVMWEEWKKERERGLILGRACFMKKRNMPTLRADPNKRIVTTKVLFFSAYSHSLCRNSATRLIKNSKNRKIKWNNKQQQQKKTKM